MVSGRPSLQVPGGVVVPPEIDPRGSAGASPSRPGFPLIAKPAWEGSSKGIRGTSLVRNEEELLRVVAELHHDHRQPVLLEEFIGGDELTVGILGNERPHILGIMRMVPLRKDPSEPFVYGLEVKRDWKRRVRYE